jgi:hypothetical protein
MEKNKMKEIKKVNSGYIRKNKDRIFEVKYFETLKQRQKYLLSMKEFEELKMYKNYTKSFIDL